MSMYQDAIDWRTRFKGDDPFFADQSAASQYDDGQHGPKDLWNLSALPNPVCHGRKDPRTSDHGFADPENACGLPSDDAGAFFERPLEGFEARNKRDSACFGSRKRVAVRLPPAIGSADPALPRSTTPTALDSLQLGRWHVACFDEWANGGSE
jgi:hypothetical protein